MLRNPGQTANSLKISSQTLRRWSTEFASVLSPEANPPAGRARRFTEQDIAFLREAGRLMRAGKTATEAASTLATLDALALTSAEAPEPTPAPANATPDLTERLARALETLADQRAAIERHAEKIASLEHRLNILENGSSSWVQRLFHRH